MTWNLVVTLYCQVLPLKYKELCINVIAVWKIKQARRHFGRKWEHKPSHNTGFRIPVYHIFASSNSDYRWVDRVYHHIDTAEACLICQPLRRLPLAKQAEVGEMLEDMWQCGVIEEAESLWLSPIILVQKKNGDLRFCVE
jgi:hypothetical protein